MCPDNWAITSWRDIFMKKFFAHGLAHTVIGDPAPNPVALVATFFNIDDNCLCHAGQLLNQFMEVW